MTEANVIVVSIVIIVFLLFNNIIYKKPLNVKHRKQLRTLISIIAVLQLIILLCANIGSAAVDASSSCQFSNTYLYLILLMGLISLVLTVWSFVFSLKDKQYVACVLLVPLFVALIGWTLAAGFASSFCLTF